MGIIAKWNSIGLVPRIVMGLVVGAVLGLTIPLIPADTSAVSGIISILGTIFVSALKAVAPVLVFFLVMSALANAKGAGNMGTVIALYLVSTFVAALVAVLASFIFPMHLTLVGVEAADQSSPQGVGEVLGALITNMVYNPVGSIVNGNYIGILLWAVLLGIALRNAKAGTKQVLSDIAAAITTVVRWIIAFAPFGILGLVYAAVVENGPEIFQEYGMLILLLVGCMFFIALVTNPIMVFVVTRKNPYPLVFRCLKDSAITAFFTRSSAANIPVNMELCQKLGLDKNNYSVSIPLGATINMAGAAVTISVMAMQTAFTTGTAIDVPTAVVLSALAAISACGASGVPGGSLLLIPMACSLFGIDPEISMLVVGIGFIIGVIQDSCETALNSSSDVLFTATAEYRKWIKAGRKFTMGKDNEPLLAEVETIEAEAVEDEEPVDETA